MEFEPLTEYQEERLIKINFIYDPGFIPPWHGRGEIDQNSPKNNTPLGLYATSRSEEWNKNFSPLISPVIRKIFALSFNPLGELKCYVLEHRVKISENIFLEASSKPLAVWAKPAQLTWNYLPFHARVTHELSHLIGKTYSPVWENLEDEVWNQNRNREDFWSHEPLREELVVRWATYLITKELFGEKFATWFLELESAIIPS